MYAIDKFHTDAEKIARLHSELQSCHEALRQLFIPYTKGYGDTGSDVFQYWQDEYGAKPSEHIGWLTDVLYLLDADPRAFDRNPPCFTPADWDELSAIVSANAGVIDLDVLTSVMQIIMQFHGIA